MLLHHFLALVARLAFAAPANFSQVSIPASPTPDSVSTGSSSQLVIPPDVSSSVVPMTSTLPVTPTALANLTNTVISDLSLTVPTTTPLTSYFIPHLSVLSSNPTTYFVTEVVTAFRTTTIDETPSPTSFLTVVVTETATSTVAPTETSTSLENRTQWVAPSQMVDLSAFNVTYFPTGKRNLRIVSEIPSEAFASSTKFIQSSLATSPNASAILQLVYPANSVNPGSKPAGGADFYATPLDLSGARNVTLKYSVLFPADFDWVKGGKLPGLFGGHTGCSGGASARDCFSTRLMWRPQGVGELYLYAPKDKQSDALCTDVTSVCDVTYGFSIGRGTFNFSAGDWTHLAQNVVLNTPGRNDGGFTLNVDGRVVIERTDMFYRDMPVGRRLNMASTTQGLFEPSSNDARYGATVRLGDDDTLQPTEFLGLFFSTFFGGHGEKYATPRQQYTWFKDFAIIRHD